MKFTLSRHSVLEYVLLLGSAVLFVVTALGVIGAAGDEEAQQEDLTYEATLRELSMLLRSGGRDQLATLSRVVIPVGDQAVGVDQIELLIDERLEPGAAAGGFIADQADAFNDYAIRQAIERAFYPALQAVPHDEGPSLFRTAVTDDGRRTLSTQLNPFVMVVRSPYAERYWRDVRASDWQRNAGVLGLSGDVMLGGDIPDRSTTVLNNRNCVVRNQPPRLLLYCTSALASDVGRFFDLGFQVAQRGSPLGLSTVFTPRAHRLTSSSSGDAVSEYSLHAGDVFDSSVVGPFVVSLSERGALAASQWINGKPTFANQRLGTVSFFAGAGRSRTASVSGPLILSLNAALSHDLEAESRRFMQSQRGRLRRMAVVVIDAATGELRAVAEPARATDTEPLLSFEPILVGSVVKPMLSAALLARNPGLANLTLHYAGNRIGQVAGVSLRSEFSNAANGCAGVIDFENFLRCSSNHYAAELLFRSLRADGFRAPTNGMVPTAILERSSLGNGLAEVFDVDAFGRRTSGRNPALWTYVSRGPGQSRSATTNRALLPWESRPWVVFPDTEGTPVDWLARYAFGGWENRWTLLGTAEAYARIATGRMVEATIVPTEGTTRSPAPPSVASAFSRVRAGLRRVALDGTAAGLSADVERAMPNGMAVLAKTGTLNEDTDRFKALAMVVGQSSGNEATASIACGVVAVTYFEFEMDDAASGTPLPAVHLEFARGPFASLLARHWHRLAPCNPIPAVTAR